MFRPFVSYASFVRQESLLAASAITLQAPAHSSAESHDHMGNPGKFIISYHQTKGSHLKKGDLDNCMCEYHTVRHQIGVPFRGNYIYLLTNVRLCDARIAVFKSEHSFLLSEQFCLCITVSKQWAVRKKIKHWIFRGKSHHVCFGSKFAHWNVVGMSGGCLEPESTSCSNGNRAALILWCESQRRDKLLHKNRAPKKIVGIFTHLYAI